jgi:hypothetical protein
MQIKAADRILEIDCNLDEFNSKWNVNLQNIGTENVVTFQGSQPMPATILATHLSAIRKMKLDTVQEELGVIMALRRANFIESDQLMGKTIKELNVEF